ncbi:hypothetical protein Q1695_011193 [Nippostrongylus brasiliensis]|nr:hypothetical protein Q1695_011193 [Nippostrongylus brasiliensis]
MLRNILRAGRSTFQPALRWISTTAEPGDLIVPKSEVMRYMTEVMKSVKVNPSHCQQLAEVLMEADIRGHYSHGLNRLEMYANDINKKVCQPDGTPKIEKEKGGSALVDGQNLLGPVVGNFCMNLAVKKAKEAGVGWVTARASNHFGICGWYISRAMEHGVMAMAFTSTSPLMFPTRAAKAALGTNPLSLGAMGTGGDYFLLDMATTAVAIGKVEIFKRKGRQIPPGWGVGGDGKPSTDCDEILAKGGLFPLGGPELNSGYKGYGLGALVEIFCGVLGGAHWGPHIRKWKSGTTPADLGQCFICIDTEAFAPGFNKRMQEFIDTMRNLPPADGEKVLVPGDQERMHAKSVEEYGGIPYHPNQIKNAAEVAKKFNVKPMEVLKEFK